MLKRILAVIAFCAASLPGVTCLAQDEAKLKQECIDAAKKAIELEVERVQQRMKEPSDDVKKPDFEGDLALLARDKKNLDATKLEDYKIPKKLTLVGKRESDGRIKYELMPRFGPFYFIVVSTVQIEEKKTYEFEFYVVYRKTYPFRGFYVYVTSATERPEGAGDKPAADKPAAE